MPEYYPINLNLADKKCLVVGAGGVAERKVRRLLECGARVTAIGLKVTPRLERLSEQKKIVLKNRRVLAGDLAGVYLVISAASDRQTNSFVSSLCRKKGILINAADSPKECDFILPAVVKKGDLTLTVSTGGTSPALSQKIRRDLERGFGPEYAKILRLMKRLRPQALERIKDPRARKKFFHRVVGEDILALLKQNKQKEALNKIKGILVNAEKPSINLIT